MALKLYYFGLKGRAEPTRLALVIGGIAFEDVRVAREDWPALKHTMPFQAMPVLEVDGKKLSQSPAILRYAGKLAGLVPEDTFEAALMDEILMGMELEVTNSIVPTMYIQDVEAKMAARKKLAEETLPRHLANLEKLVCKTSDWAVGESMTIADLQLYQGLGWLTNGTLDGIPKTIVDEYPKLKKICAKVAEHPKVVEWEAAHP